MVILQCFNDSTCVNSGRCLSGIFACTTHEIRYHALTLPIMGAIQHDIPSLRYIYLFIFIFLASTGLISNIFPLVTFLRDRIRLTICGVYLTMFSLSGLILMVVFLTNIIVTLRYDDYLFHLWACHGYPYVFLVMIYTSVLMSTAIMIESILNQYFSFDRFRSRIHRTNLEQIPLGCSHIKVVYCRLHAFE